MTTASTAESTTVTDDYTLSFLRRTLAKTEADAAQLREWIAALDAERRRTAADAQGERR
jgi:hypothetical protein